jgi:hypothetical protein
MISSRLDGTIVGRLCQTPIHRTGVWQNGAAGDASDMDGQAGRLSEREQASQTPTMPLAYLNSNVALSTI